MTIKETSKDTLLCHLLEGIQAQFASTELNILHVKLASIASACYLSVLKHWLR